MSNPVIPAQYAALFAGPAWPQHDRSRHAHVVKVQRDMAGGIDPSLPSIGLFQQHGYGPMGCRKAQQQAKKRSNAKTAADRVNRAYCSHIDWPCARRWRGASAHQQIVPVLSFYHLPGGKLRSIDESRLLSARIRSIFFKFRQRDAGRTRKEGRKEGICSCQRYVQAIRPDCVAQRGPSAA